jgi:tetratricopeptide (TPR) repeat protein
MANTEFDKYVAEGDACFEKEDWENALTAYTKALNIDDGNADCYFMRAQCYYNMADDDKAWVDFANFLKRNVVTGPREIEAYYGQGLCNMNLKDYGLAVNNFTKCLESEGSKDSPYLLRMRGDARRLEVGDCCMDYDEEVIMADYNACLKQEPNNAEALYGRGKTIWLFQDEENFPQAMNDLDASLEIDPDNADAWYLRGQLHEQKGCNSDDAIAEFEQALDDWEKAVELDPDHKEAVNSRDSMRKTLND